MQANFLATDSHTLRQDCLTRIYISSMKIHSKRGPDVSILNTGNTCRNILTSSAFWESGSISAPRLTSKDRSRFPFSGVMFPVEEL